MNKKKCLLLYYYMQSKSFKWTCQTDAQTVLGQAKSAGRIDGAGALQEVFVVILSPTQFCPLDFRISTGTAVFLHTSEFSTNHLLFIAFPFDIVCVI